MISPDLMEILCCPQCRGTLVEVSHPEGLHCQRCRLLYAIVDGIPNLLIEEAQPYTPKAAAPRP